jgi:2-polyprenyl-3-methyl-5-hydroxy-6-metoxy-1,4-benzoquinol methylase
LNPLLILNQARHLSPEEWLDVLINSTQNNEWNGITLPSFPDPAMQASFVGSSNTHALREGLHFYRVILHHLKTYSNDLTPDSKVLDFGVGWGRYMRFFYRDVALNNLYGVDPWHLAIDLCKETNVHGQLLQIGLRPPMVLADETFDLVFAYSVFSHLSPDVGSSWVEELARCLKPGGMLVVTTQGRTFIDYCASLRDKPSESLWHQALQKSFSDVEKMYSDYDAGNILYAANGGGEGLPPDVYGDAIVPKQHVEKHWTKHLELVNFIDDRNLLPQALIVMKKPK